MAPASPQLLGYSESGAEMVGRPLSNKPSITVAYPDQDGRECYRMEFFGPAERLVHQKGPVISPAGVSFLSTCVPPGDLDWRRMSIAEHVDCDPPGSCAVQLTERIADGRTGTVWRAECNPPFLEFPLIVKMMDCFYLPSIIKETLFYERIFPNLTMDLDSIRVPRFMGTYGHWDGGWYAILMEDVGDEIAPTTEWNEIGWDPELQVYDEAKRKEAQDVQEKVQHMADRLEKLGVRHVDVSPRNVLRRREDGELYLIDFGEAEMLPHCKPCF